MNTEDKTKVLNEIIRNTVVYQEAVKLGLEADYNEAYSQMSAAYKALKENGGENLEFLENYMKELNLSEEEYLKKGAKAYQQTLTRGNLYTHFTEGKTGSYEELSAEYSEYVKQLVAEAEIEYK